MSTESDDQHSVLSEVSHDLANRFHRSYYFLELLEDALDPTSESAPSLLAGLRGTVEDIEAMTRDTLALVRPLELRMIRVRLQDLTASMRQHLGLREVSVHGEAELGPCEVEVDPTRISEALGLVCSLATDGDGSVDPMVVELVSGNPLGLKIHRAPGAAKAGPSDRRLALARKILRVHGGTLDQEAGDLGSLVMSLPAAARRT